MSSKGSWIGIAVIVALAVLVVFNVLLKVGGHWDEILAVIAFLGTLVYGLSR